jgi:uncharacterized protein
MTFTAFLGLRRVATGELPAMRQALATFAAPASTEPLLFFDDATGQQVELELHGIPPDPPAVPRPRGRPALGVVAREVTLLPRHWEWLALQPGGASVALRKLVDEARRTQAPRDVLRAAQERTFRFLNALAGNLPGFEETVRALYARDPQAFDASMAGWPQDVRDYARALAGDAVFAAP